MAGRPAKPNFVFPQEPVTLYEGPMRREGGVTPVDRVVDPEVGAIVPQLLR